MQCVSASLLQLQRSVNQIIKYIDCSLCCLTLFLLVLLHCFSQDHPGFHYSADGDKKDSPQTKEGPTPRRGRRKGETWKIKIWKLYMFFRY